MKRIFVILLCVVLLLAFMPTVAFAAEDVASVGGSAYTSLKDAVDGAEAGAEITLLQNIVLTEDITVNKNLTFKGNYSITFYENQMTEHYRMRITDGAEVTFDGVTLTGSYGADVAAPFISLSGTSKLTVKNGSIIDTSIGFSSGYGLINTMGTAAGSKVTLDSCTVVSKKGADGPTYYVIGGGAECELDIKNCELELASWLMFNVFATGTISNCDFKSGVAINATGLKGLTVTGCTFREEMSGTRFVLGGDYTLSNNVFEDLGDDLALTIWNGPSAAGKAQIIGNTFNLITDSYGIRLYSKPEWGANGGNAAYMTITDNIFKGDCYYQIRNNDGWEGTVNVDYNYFNGTAPKAVYGANDTSVGSIECDFYYLTEDLTGIKTEDPVPVELPKDTVDQAIAEEKPVIIQNDSISASFDVKTLEAIKEANQAEEAVTLTVKPILNTELNEEQQAVAEDLDAQVIIKAEILVGNTKVSQFNGGKVTLFIPFDGNGESLENFTVAYIDDEGNVTKCDTTVSPDEDGLIVELEHFSEYVVAKTSTVDALVKEQAGETGDNGIALWTVLFLIAALGVAATTVLGKKARI